MPNQLPVDDFGLQLAKLGHGMCSGAYSWPSKSSETEEVEGKLVPRLPNIRPTLFRRLVGKNHPEFSTRRLQDAQEFLTHFLALVEKDSLNAPPVIHHSQALNTDVQVYCPIQNLQFAIEERLQCGSTGCVRYSQSRDYCVTIPIPLDACVNKEAFQKGENEVRPRVPLEACVAAWAADSTINDWLSPATGPPNQKTFATMRNRFLTFPDFLCLHASRFVLESNWTARKLDVELILNDDDGGKDDELTKLNNWRIDLSPFKASGGLQSGEVAMPKGVEEEKDGVQPNAEIVSQLVEMGFLEEACKNACIRTNNSGLEAAAQWVMEHLDDPEPLAKTAKGNPPDESMVEMLMAMGFDRRQALRAFRKTDNNLEAAADYALTNIDDLNAPDTPPPATGMSIGTDQVTPENAPLADGPGLYELVGLVSHMGKTTNDGHYVCHLKRSALSLGLPDLPVCKLPTECQCPTVCSADDWIIFNDEKVAKSELPPFRFAYLYLLRRVGTPTD